MTDPGYPAFTDKKHEPAGTAKYLAPEKWDGDYTKGFKGDVFAFGVMAYYASTGKHPFDGTNAQIEQAIREAKPPSPLKSGHHVLRTVAVIIMIKVVRNAVVVVISVLHIWNSVVIRIR